MGAEEIYKYLKRNRSWKTAKTISKSLGLNIASVRKSLNILVRYNDIECKYQHTKQKGWTVANKLVKSRKAWMYRYKKNRGGQNGKRE